MSENTIKLQAAVVPRNGKYYVVIDASMDSDPPRRDTWTSPAYDSREEAEGKADVLLEEFMTKMGFKIPNKA